jgi:predicted alpha/beta superfamily hydrolase
VASSLNSALLNEQRELWIHLPNGGELRPGAKYPVMYVLDGGVHLGGLAMIQEYYNYFRLPEMIVVGISNRTHRTRDLTTSKVESRQGMRVESSGGAELFTRFLAEELIPHIEKQYPVSSHRTLIGHSYAGLFVINTLIHHRGLFRNHIAIDPSLGWDDQKLLKQATSALAKEDFTGSSLYVSMANELTRFSETLGLQDLMHDTTEFSLSMRSILEFVHTVEAKKSNGLQFAWAYYEKDLHGSVPLISMRDGLIFLFDWWELKHPSRYNDPKTSTEDILALIRKRTQTLTTNLGYPLAMAEELLIMLGQLSLGSDQALKARRIFELGLEYYPESAELHGSLADVCLDLDDRKSALLHASRAFEITSSKEHEARLTKLRADG